YGDDLAHADVVVLLMPAVVIGDHCYRDVAQLRLSREAGFRQVGHANHIHAPIAIQIRLGFGRELRSFHVKVRAALLHVYARAPASLRQYSSLFFANGMPESNVYDQSVAKECVYAMTRAIDKLVGDDKIQRMMFLFQRTDGR